MRSLDPPCPLGDIAAYLGIELDPDHKQRLLRRLATLGGATRNDLSFFADARYLKDLPSTRAGAVLISEAHADKLPPETVAMIVADPYLAFARVSSFFAERIRGSGAAAGISPGAFVSKSAILGERVTIGHGAVIGQAVLLGSDVSIGPGVVVGDNTRIGRQTRVFPNVTIGTDCRIGANCVVQAGSVIGADGFGYARDGKAWQKIEQLGSVVIGDRVEIGANCCIDRGAIEDTIIEADCILDNLIQVAHNVRIGAGSALAACVGIAGSASLGKRCLIGGGVGILGHLHLCDDVVLSPMSLVTRSLNKPGFYSGTFPLMTNEQWEKSAAVLRRLPDLRTRLRQLEKLTQQLNQ
ncbi:MAG: UDP-3-O-(3-hydroxymyristoyl)glucosamine N-acyltransferase [Burkholderiaceae bacterium]